MRLALTLAVLLTACSGSSGPEWCQMTFHFTLPDSLPTVTPELLSDTTAHGIGPDSVTTEPCA
jgi:hypothetical protein